MKKYPVIPLAVAIAMTLSGCSSYFLPSRIEIDQFEIVQVVGIDACREIPGQVEVSFVSTAEKGGSSQGEGGGARQITVLSSVGRTIFEAERGVKAHSDKVVFFGHVDYFLIGEQAARENFDKFFDFISRDHEERLSPKVFIVTGCSAREFLNTTSSEDKFIGDRLKNIETDISILSDTDQVRIIDVSRMLDQKDSAVIIPALKYIPLENEEMQGGTLPEKDVEEAGYAVIKDFRLTGYIDEPIARGYNFLTNKVESCPIAVKDDTGLLVGLEVLNSKTKVEAHFKGNQLTGVTYKTNVLSNIQEEQSRENIFTPSALKKLTAEQSETIKAEMEQVIEKSREYGIDCTNLARQIKMQHPLKWEKIKKTWTEIYPKLKIDVEVKSEIQRTYDIHEPNGYKVGEK